MKYGTTWSQLDSWLCSSGRSRFDAMICGRYSEFAMATSNGSPAATFCSSSSPLVMYV